MTQAQAPPSSGTPPLDVTPGPLGAADWQRVLSGSDHVPPLPGLGLCRGDRAVFVGAHPDDETFAAGATLAALARHGVVVHVMTMSAGDAALDGVGRNDPGLGQRRGAEFAAACRHLGASSALVGPWPDGALSDHREELVASVHDRVVEVDASMVLATWWRDPHPDHEAVGLAVRQVGSELDVPVAGFPVWAHHWLDVGDAPRHVTVMDNSPLDQAQRRRAEAEYTSQTQSQAPDLGPVLPDWFLRWDIEYAVRPR